MKPFLIAEMSCNHLGSLKRALAIVDAAADAGASAVKLQAFSPEQMVAPGVIQKDGPWAGRELLDLYREAHTPRPWFPVIFERAKERGIVPFASVFHPDDVDFVLTLGCEILKIASFELTDLNLIRYAAKTGKRIVMSTGMASVQEVDDACHTVLEAGCTDCTVLRCVSAYPADASDANLATMADVKRGWPMWNVGLSDHSIGIGVSVAAVALGATTIERHLTLRRSDGGPDAAFSMEPDEFAQLVIECRRAEQAIGEVRYGPTKAEAASLRLRRQSGGMRGESNNQRIK